MRKNSHLKQHANLSKNSCTRERDTPNKPRRSLERKAKQLSNQIAQASTRHATHTPNSTSDVPCFLSSDSCKRPARQKLARKCTLPGLLFFLLLRLFFLRIALVSAMLLMLLLLPPAAASCRCLLRRLCRGSIAASALSLQRLLRHCSFGYCLLCLCSFLGFFFLLGVFPASHLTYTNLHDSTLLRGSAAADAATLKDKHDRRRHANTTGVHTYATTPARTPTHTPTTNAAQCLRQRGGDHWVERGGEMGGGANGGAAAQHTHAPALLSCFFFVHPPIPFS